MVTHPLPVAMLLSSRAGVHPSICSAANQREKNTSKGYHTAVQTLNTARTQMCSHFWQII